MDITAVREQIEILRRIAERGLSRSLCVEETNFVDLFQHILDEIQNTKRLL